MHVVDVKCTKRTHPIYTIWKLKEVEKIQKENSFDEDMNCKNSRVRHKYSR